MDLDQQPVIRNEENSRFEMNLEGKLAVAEYRIAGRQMIFTYTGVPPAFRGQGIGEKLVLAGLNAARAEGCQVVPQCSYVGHVIARHPEFRELL